ncbi:MAG: AbgT family transporter [Bacteroidetes bacterium]|nr:AbgT family transporter [Bacteroidota bacterium]MBU1579149.1 AbgT family transporter [Bacteroidota bacterium]MBU2464931.1 AbgT family transporter [Bacteroidota bacterium]MBU2557912.1 AbgT family transporter [Bacteroidota bacterium]
MPAAQQRPKGFVDKFLYYVEKVGNALPHPATLFAIFAALALVLSWVASQFDLEVIHPGTGELIQPVNLLSVHGLHMILTNMVTNFTGFAPLGVVLVAMLGIGIAEGSGLIGTALRLMVLSSPRRILTFVVVFAGILSNTASEVGYVLLIPLSAIIFLAVGRHPIAGMAAAFAGVSGGYSANLLLGTIDPLLAGLSQEAAQIIDPGYVVNPAANYYFMFVSTFFIAAAGTWVTDKIVEPRLGKYEGTEEAEEIKRLNAAEKKGLRYAVVAAFFLIALMLWGTLPASGFLRDAETGSLLHSPFMEGIVAIIFITAAIMGIAYGVGAGTFKNDSDVMKGMGKSMETLGVYIVLVFFAAQFVAYFKWTNLGLIFAIEGAGILQSSGLGSIPLMIGFIIITAIINMVMGSASAKWTIMAPVFIPMFMLIGYSPELTQVVYRIGDSVTNIISPMMSYFALIVAFMQKYDKNAGIGTIISTMLPYTFVFSIIWIILLVIWMIFGLPIGPDAPLTYQMN